MQLIRFNWKSLLLFELVYKLIAWAICYPLVIKLFHVSLNVSGYRYITAKNIVDYFLFPSTLPFLLLVIVISLLFITLELAALAHAMDASYHQRKITSKEIWIQGAQTAARLLGTRNRGSLILLLFAVPVLGFLFTPTFLPDVKIPEFINDYIASNFVFNLIFFALIFIGTVLIIRWMFVFHCFALSDGSLRDAFRECAKMTWKRMFKNVLLLIWWSALFFGSFLLILLIGFTGVFLITDSTWTLLFVLLPAVCLIAIGIILVLTVPLQFCVVSALFYRWQQDNGIKPRPFNMSRILWTPRKKILIAVMAVILFVFSTYNFVDWIKNEEWFGETKLVMTEITAHRGNTGDTIENTRSSFEAAIHTQADVIELDVQPTKDGVPVVFHDADLKRMSGVQRKLSDITYAELQTIPLLNTNNEMIPSLRDVLDLCNGKIKLNIELKNFNEDFIKKVIALVKETNMQNQSIITSLNYEALQFVKERYPRIETGFVTAVAYGEIGSMEYVDYFSVEASFVTQTLVNDIHKKGKKILVWTVNNELEMERIFNLGVDGLITDKPIQAMELRKSMLKNP
ncbi:glycerophosphodiester phosphodiesterase family protein [Paenibacillus radicibacter]|uniref:glycerophosphodiester phosphodiesterase family protein n=1 Tax=Paenibacillus radicibacter TaxID=2972488 RepID=UPI002158D281|nr:glycerophosphodiester phosphodiesterase family protein [Paenibacillus radicibacter]